MLTGFWWLTCGIFPLGRPVRIYKDNIKMDLILLEIDCNDGRWMKVVQDGVQW